VVKSLLALIAIARSAPLLELLGAAAIAGGVYLLAGWAGALITIGVFLLLKSLELDLAKPER
jgi:hypothetical protein